MVIEETYCGCRRLNSGSGMSCLLLCYNIRPMKVLARSRGQGKALCLQNRNLRIVYHLLRFDLLRKEKKILVLIQDSHRSIRNTYYHITEA